MSTQSILGNSFIKASELTDLECVKTSLKSFNEDLLVIGGLPRGRIIEIYAKKSGAKTSLCQWLIKEFQAQGLKCAWADAEGTFHKPYAESAGINLSDLDMIQFGSGEDLLYKIKMAIASNFYDLIILDSINTVTPAEIADAEIDGLSMHKKMEGPKMWSDFFKSIDGGYHIKSPVTGKPIPSNVITKRIDEKKLVEVTDPNWHRIVQKKTILIMINHKMDRVGVTFGTRHYTPGGSRKEFSFSLQLNLSVVETKRAQVKGKQVLKYKIIEVKTDKNKVGEPIRTLYLKLTPDGQFSFYGFKKSGDNIKDDEDETDPLENLRIKLTE